MNNRVVLVAFEGAQGLDLFGPAEVFAAVGRRDQLPRYEIVVAAVGGGAIHATSGVELTSRALERIVPRASDTVLVVGGEAAAIGAAVASAPLSRWLVRAATIVRRIGSVCSGAFVLAQAGILDGRRAATHWSACAQLAAFRPSVDVDPNAIYVRDGRVWTSAGVTTGIDMSLAMVEEDHGRRVADAIAARLVLHARRPGFRSQWSDALVAQTSASDPLAPAVLWARKHLGGALDVSRLARGAGMSLRTLHRRCKAELGTTPRRLVELLRIEHARTLLVTTKLGTKTIAARSGFGSTSQMTRAFDRTLGVAPGELRLVSGA